MAFKVSFKFSQVSSLTAGWTENFWQPGTDLSVCKQNAANLAAVLLPCHAFPVTLTGWRISTVGPPRSVLNIPFPNGLAPSYFGGADYPNSAVLVKFGATLGYFTNQWIRGLPDNVLENSGLYLPGNFPPWTTAFNALCAQLVLDGWSVRVLDKLTQYQPVSNFNYALGTWNAPINPLAAFPLNKKARLRGMGLNSPANGVFNITWTPPVGPVAAYAQIDNWQPSTYVPPSVPRNPIVTQQNYIYPIMVLNAFGPSTPCGSVLRGTSHKSGRPSGLFSGKARRRRR